MKRINILILVSVFSFQLSFPAFAQERTLKQRADDFLKSVYTDPATDTSTIVLAGTGIAGLLLMLSSRVSESKGVSELYRMSRELSVTQEVISNLNLAIAEEMSRADLVKDEMVFLEGFVKNPKGTVQKLLAEYMARKNALTESVGRVNTEMRALSVHEVLEKENSNFANAVANVEDRISRNNAMKSELEVVEKRIASLERSVANGYAVPDYMGNISPENLQATYARSVESEVRLVDLRGKLETAQQHAAGLNRAISNKTSFTTRAGGKLLRAIGFLGGVFFLADAAGSLYVVRELGRDPHGLATVTLVESPKTQQKVFDFRQRNNF